MTYLPCSSVSIVNFEHVIAGWGSQYSRNIRDREVLPIDYCYKVLHVRCLRGVLVTPLVAIVRAKLYYYY